MDGFLTAGDIESLRDLMREAMTEVATIKRFMRVEDDAGGFTGPPDPQVVATDVPVFRVPEVAGVGERQIAGQVVQGLRWKLFFPVDTDVRHDDHIEIGTDTYSVMDMAGPTTLDAARLVYALRR